MITVSRLNHEQFEQDMEDTIKLCATWWDDTVFKSKLDIDFVPNKEAFRQMQNLLIAVFLRDTEKNNQVIGAYVAIVMPYIFNPNYKQASEVVWCIEKSYRGYGLANKLIEETEKHLKELNIDLASLSIATNKLSFPIKMFLNKKGYIKSDDLYYKRLS